MMIKFAQRLAVALIAALAFALPASATTYSTDFSDVWWVGPQENGWGINFIQQSNVIFATMFVYGQDGTPRWYVASALDPQSAGSTTFTGILYRTTGPHFGGPWTANAVATPVGNMTVAFNTATTATLNYTVDGVPVRKTITRQALRESNISGNYLGGITANSTNCGNGASNGAILIFGNLAVTQTGQALSMRINFVSNTGIMSTCNMNGNLGFTGKMGALNGGNWSCTFGSQAGNVGTFSLNAVHANVNGFSANFSGQDQFCTYSGKFGGLKDIL